MQSWLYSGFKPWLGSSLGFIRKLSYDLFDFLCNQKCSFLNNHLIFDKMWVYYFFNSHLLEYLKFSFRSPRIHPTISRILHTKILNPPSDLSYPIHPTHFFQQKKSKISNFALPPQSYAAFSSTAVYIMRSSNNNVSGL